mmetsp:Transcript_20846/g.23176  ORF Transcript_20846/g.23176 Transcript_20846/m.23176 type:complete len:122 (-) Transcript_20846:237-602(-)
MSKLKALGVDEVIVFCVNDGAVMEAWSQDQGVPTDGLLTMMGDPTGALTKAMGIELTHPGPAGKGLIGRCKRSATYLVDGEVKHFVIAERADDPAGDDFPETTCAPAMLDVIRELQVKMEL